MNNTFDDGLISNKNRSKLKSKSDHKKMNEKNQSMAIKKKNHLDQICVGIQIKSNPTLKIF